MRLLLETATVNSILLNSDTCLNKIYLVKYSVLFSFVIFLSQGAGDSAAVKKKKKNRKKS